MKNNFAKTPWGALLLTLGLGLLVGRYLLPATSTSGDAGAHVAHPDTGSSTPAAPTVWTCSMHPQIQQPAPGACPICGMDLIPLRNTDDAETGPRTLSMSEASRGLADIRTTAVERNYPEKPVRLVGKLGYDETLEKTLTARFPARIDSLHVNYTGITVHAGEHLAEIYSPELFTAQRELLTAHQSAPGGEIERIIRDKLRLWGLLPAQIDAIAARGEPSDHFTLRAPIGGVVITKNISEGSYVKTGDPLFRIADLSRLWLQLEAYESDLPWLHFGQEVTFTVAARPGQTFSGQITFIEPEIDARSRTATVRVNVANPDGHLKPGMFVQGTINSRLDAAGQIRVPHLAGKWISPMHPEVIKDGPGSCDVCGMDLVPAESLGLVNADEAEAPLLVPASAVLQTGRRAVVYVQETAAERPTYTGREIELGPRAGDYYLVAAGLEEGDRVVTHGAFKIDSALQIQAKPSMMNPAAAAPDAVATAAPGIELDPELAAQLLPAYFDLHAALAGDDLPGAQSALRAMMEITGHQGPLPDLIHELLGAQDLDTIRRPHFETMSNAFAAAVRARPEAFDRPVHLMHCPMVYDDRGADWLQPDEELRNPYFGEMMLLCGEVRGRLDQPDAAATPAGHQH